MYNMSPLSVCTSAISKSQNSDKTLKIIDLSVKLADKKKSMFGDFLRVFAGKLKAFGDNGKKIFATNAQGSRNSQKYFVFVMFHGRKTLNSLN